MGDKDGLSDIDLIVALQQLAKEAQGAKNMPPKSISQTMGGSHYTMAKAQNQEYMDKAMPDVQGVLDHIVQQILNKLSTLSRVSLQGTDVRAEVILQNDKIVFTLLPLSRYAKLVFEEVKEQYTEEELKKG